MSTLDSAYSPSAGGTTGARPFAHGFLTDTTLCIGCKACEVACKQWNQLPSDNMGLTGFSYDNTRDLGATTWRHVAFVEQLDGGPDGARPTELAPYQSNWLMMSDVCKHCVNAPCMEVCPTGALVRSRFDTVIVQAEVCNGCGYCVPACPFGVVDLSPSDGKAHKCTLCYDRLADGLEPACAKACPTDSIQFGLLEHLMPAARERVASLREQGVEGAYVYGDEESGGTGGIGGLNAFFVLTAPPDRYNLPAQPELPTRKTYRGYLSVVGASVVAGLAVAFSLRNG